LDFTFTPFEIKPDSKATFIHPSFSYQDVELLPALGKVDPVLDGVGVPNVDEGEVLQHQPDVGDAGRGGLTQCRPTVKQPLREQGMTSYRTTTTSNGEKRSEIPEKVVSKKRRHQMKKDH
jgi:hypothetical protein